MRYRSHSIAFALLACGALAACNLLLNDGAYDTNATGGGSSTSTSESSGTSPSSTSGSGTSTSSGINAGSSTSSSGAGGSDSGPSVECDPAKATGPIPASCGVFVSPTGSGNGLQGDPMSLTVALAQSKPIYACAGMYTGPFEVTMPTTLHGALDCTSWTYNAANTTTIAAPAGGAEKLVASLTFDTASSGSAVYDFTITSGSAAGMTTGVSSIAVLDDGATLSLTRCSITAGAAADGQGPLSIPTALQGATSADGVGMLDGCKSAATVVGGNAGQTTCSGATPPATNGGNGGVGQTGAQGGSPNMALPQPEPNTMPSFDGAAGQPQGSKPCLPGDTGSNGLDGNMPGAGATGVGSISAAGYANTTATSGLSSGTPGYGGGGGGGAKSCMNGFAGPAGGGGGAGGCGGDPGAAGFSGGSSIAILALNAMLTLDDTTVTASDGGNGGAGGDGQLGGQGGNGEPAGAGDSVAKACAGGNGGQGGTGSPGGGGAGGHSAGVAYLGMAPTMNGTTTITHGMAGKLGPGGMGGSGITGNPGVAGLACTMLGFNTPSVCGT